jgi:uncharacterized membrane protein
LDHPVHPLLIAFPFGLLGTAVSFELIELISGDCESLAQVFVYQTQMKSFSEARG